MLHAFEVVFYVIFPLSPVEARQIRRRVVGGLPDDGHEFPFVVMFQLARPPCFRGCSGSLVTPTWVLTAAHCTPANNIQVELTRIKYGDSTIPSNKTKSFTKIIKAVRHPAFREIKTPKVRTINDIGLVKVEKIANVPLAKLSAVDYMAFMGLPVKYAGFGRTKLLPIGAKELTGDGVNILEDVDPPLSVGESVVISCKQYGNAVGIPHICIAPRCGPHQQAYFGDSGGPMVYNGRNIGVACDFIEEAFKYQIPLMAYTAVSPFVDWIHDTIISDRDS